MSDILKRIEIPIALTIIATLLQVIPYYFDIQVLKDMAGTATNAVLLIVACATFWASSQSSWFTRNVCRGGLKDGTSVASL